MGQRYKVIKTPVYYCYRCGQDFTANAHNGIAVEPKTCLNPECRRSDWNVPPKPKKTCTVPGCGKRAVAKKLCMTHYQQKRREGSLNVTNS